MKAFFHLFSELSGNNGFQIRKAEWIGAYQWVFCCFDRRGGRGNPWQHCGIIGRWVFGWRREQFQGFVSQQRARTEKTEILMTSKTNFIKKLSNPRVFFFVSNDWLRAAAHVSKSFTRAGKKSTRHKKESVMSDSQSKLMEPEFNLSGFVDYTKNVPQTSKTTCRSIITSTYLNY